MSCFARYLIMCIVALGSTRLWADDGAAEDVAAVAAPASAPDIAAVSDAAAAPAVAAAAGAAAPANVVSGEVSGSPPSEVARGSRGSVHERGPQRPIDLPAEEAAATEPAAAAPVAVAPDSDAGTTAPPMADVVATVATVAPVVAGTAAANAGPAAGTGFADADRIVVHKSKRRLELLKGGAVVAEYPIRLGLNPEGHKLREGDFRTPEGHYYLSRRNPRSDFFLSIEVSYPNDADRRRARGNGKAPGGSIMIHGQPNVPRKPADYYTLNDWTDGCIAVSNSDMVDIWLRTKVGLPIDIRP